MTKTVGENILNINRNIFGDTDNGDRVTAMYTNFLTERIISGR